jgi:DNA mismatch endonuclease, patch repair protein
MAQSPRYHNLAPSSARASAAARGASRKTNTKPEILLRRALWHQGFRYNKNRADLPGRPDIVFWRARVIVFVDGDFWHGNNWIELKAKLAKGHNPDYWIGKIEGNMQRDSELNRELCQAGWFVLRIWESEIYADLDRLVRFIELALRQSAERL